MRALWLFLAALLWTGATQAQTLETLNDRSLTVRFCPSQCQAVTGHGLSAGKQVRVFERRNGWARVSDFYSRRKLRRSFGRDLPRKPALWVPVGNLAVAAAPAAKPEPTPAKRVAKEGAPQKPRTRRIDVVTRIARLRNAPRPSFRPGSQFAAAAVSAPAQTAEVVEPIGTAEPVEATQQQTPAAGEASTREQVQDRLKKQAAAVADDATARAEVDAEAQAALDAEAARQAAAELEATAAREAEEATARLEARRVEEAEIAAAERAEAEADALRDTDARIDTGAGAQTEAQADLDAEREEAAMAAEEAAVEAEETIAIAMQEAVSPNAKTNAERRAALAAEVEAARKELEEAEAAILAATGEAPEPAEEPTFASAQTTPIALGNRPTKLTKALLDKRLRKLPSKASKRVPEETIIALRHYGKALLDSGECEGIAGGGRSAQPGMLFIACSDDPSYQRVFPLKETSW